MSPHLPSFAMENPNSTACIADPSSKMSTVVHSIGGILLDEERSSGNSTSPSLPSLVGLTLKIRAASLPALVELCVMAFDDDGAVMEAATNYPAVFFLMHKWFTASDSLARDFQRLFEQGKPSNSDYLSLMVALQQQQQQPPPPSSSPPNPPQSADGPTLLSRPSSVILPRKQDDCNGSVGSRSPSLRGTANGRSNSVLIPRPACIGAEDDNYLFSYHLSKLQAAMAASASTATPAVSESSGSSEKMASQTGRSATASCADDCRHDKSTLCQVYKFRRQICQAVRFWIVQFPVHFDLDPKLCTLIKDWQKQLTEDPYHYEELSSLVDLSCLPSYDWIRNISVRDPSVKHCRKVSLVFNHLEPSDLAKHLTYLEHRTMRRISFQDYKQYAVTGSLSDNPRLERSVNLFNGLTQWVQCMVLSRSTPQQRAEVIVKLIDVTKKLRELRNFNSLMAVVGGLSHSSLARLARTAARVPPDSQRTLAELTEFLSSSSNFSNYRRALQECKGFKIPILGVHMKDLISLHVALSDTVDGGLINFRKMAQLSLIFQELQELQNATPPPGANLDLVNTLRLSLELAYTEDEIYELSLAREPRDSLSPQSSPTRPSLLSEWPSSGGHPNVCNQPNMATGSTTIASHLLAHDVAVRSASLPSPPTSNLLPTRIHTSDQHQPMRFGTNDTSAAGEREEDTTQCPERSKKTLEERMKRMNEMVDAVFGPPKNELLKFLQRSPCHLSSTSDDQQNADGLLGEDHAAPCVQHDFHETSSFRPCTCAHCNGLLWGPLRQGYKCKECGLAAHKMCKDLISLRCRPKSLTVSHSPFSDVFQSSGSAGRSTRFRRRKKLSSQSDVDTLEAALLGMDCRCDLTCPSPCRPLVPAGASSCEHPSDFQDRLLEKSLSPGSVGVDSNSGGTSASSIASRVGHQMFRSPKRRSLIASTAASGPTSTVTSPMPIRQRKTSLSFTSPCRSFPGTDSSSEGQSSGSPVRHSSLSTSPRRKISDALAILNASKSSHSCGCHGHH